MKVKMRLSEPLDLPSTRPRCFKQFGADRVDRGQIRKFSDPRLLKESSKLKGASGPFLSVTRSELASWHLPNSLDSASEK